MWNLREEETFEFGIYASVNNLNWSNGFSDYVIRIQQFDSYQQAKERLRRDEETFEFQANQW